MRTVDAAYVKNAFEYHKPKGDQADRYQHINDKAKELANAILANCPESAERTLAIRDVQTAKMWANTSIAVNE